MPVVIGQSSFPSVGFSGAGLIHVKKNWSDEWTPRPDLRVRRCLAAVADHDLGTLEFEGRYGAYKLPFEAAISTRESESLLGQWVALDLLGDQGLHQQWVGRIYSERRRVHGSANQRSGKQLWVAYSPLRILQKIAIRRSYWWSWNTLADDPADEKTLIDWLPSFNYRDDRRMLYGNATAAKHGDPPDDSETKPKTKLFGESSVWTNKEILDYLLTWFVAEDGDAGPRWTLSDSADTLGGIEDAIGLGRQTTAADLISMIVPRRLGLTWDVVTTDDGFEIVVRPLLAKEYSFGGATLPVNANQITLKASEIKGAVDVDIVETDDQRYDTIEVAGHRLVICCTLRGVLAPGPHEGSLVPRWDTAALQTAYEEPFPGGTGNEGVKARDDARLTEEFRSVWRLFGVPEKWDFNGDTARPFIELSGELDESAVHPVQRAVRATLSWLPLEDGVDYRDGGENRDGIPAGVQPDFMPPIAWVQDPATGRYVPVDTRDIAVSAPKNMLGVFVDASPMAHILAKNHISDFDAGSNVVSLYDHETLVATVAFRADYAITLTKQKQEDGEPTSTPSGGKIVIPVEAELWYLAPNTVVDVDRNGVLQTSGDKGRVLRNDVARIDLAMAGAISRYWESRKRAAITFQGLLPMAGILGHILKLDDGAGDTATLQSPITSIEWIWPETESTGGASGDAAGPVTIVRTGFAL